jgi:SAM-dependent methyltransferase
MLNDSASLPADTCRVKPDADRPIGCLAPRRVGALRIPAPPQAHQHRLRQQPRSGDRPLLHRKIPHRILIGYSRACAGDQAQRLHRPNYGGDRVTKSDVLHPVEGNPDATIIADLTKADHLPSNTFDAIIFTQTLQVIYDIRTVIATLHRLLKPGGVLLATASGMAKLSLEDFDKWGEYWRFTSLSARLLFEEAFGAGNVTVRSYGNVLAAISFLEGLAVEDLKKKELDAVDRAYEVLIAVRAVKAGEAQ